MSFALTKPHSLLCLYVFFALLGQIAFASWIPDDILPKRQTAAAAPLVDFQVYEPVLTPSGTTDQDGCVYTKLLMDYEFANSYGAPFVGTSFTRSQSEAVTDLQLRGLYTSAMQLQPSHNEFYSHFPRKAVRSPRIDVPRGY